MRRPARAPRPTQRKPNAVQACRLLHQTSYWLVAANETVCVKRILIIVNGGGEPARLRAGFSLVSVGRDRFTTAPSISTHVYGFVQDGLSVPEVLRKWPMSASLIETAVPAGAGRAIDWAHLRAMTLNDDRLAADVLGLFVAQATEVAAAICDPSHDVAGLLHKLTGSARAVGAWPVAAAAKNLEAHRANRLDSTSAAAELRAQLAIACEVAASFAGPARDAGASHLDPL